MNAAICDDSELFLSQICSMFETFCRERGIDYSLKTFSSGTDFLSTLPDDYDVVFLDVDMPGINGIETARILRQNNSQVFIVFVTQFIDYAPVGYEVEAIRYLLKDQLHLTFTNCMETLSRLIATRTKHVFFKFVEGDVSLHSDDIIYIESEKHKLTFHLRDNSQTYTIYKKLDDVEAEISAKSFLRIHKSYLVNMSFIELLKRYTAILKNGVELPIPKIKYPEIHKKYILFRG